MRRQQATSRANRRQRVLLRRARRAQLPPRAAQRCRLILRGARAASAQAPRRAVRRCVWRVVAPKKVTKASSRRGNPTSPRGRPTRPPGPSWRRRRDGGSARPLHRHRHADGRARAHAHPAGDGPRRHARRVAPARPRDPRPGSHPPGCARASATQTPRAPARPPAPPPPPPRAAGACRYATRGRAQMAAPCAPARCCSFRRRRCAPRLLGPTKPEHTPESLAIAWDGSGITHPGRRANASTPARARRPFPMG